MHAYLYKYKINNKNVLHFTQLSNQLQFRTLGY